MIIPVYDATHDNIAHLPKGRAAGYVTGSGGVQWTDADWAAHPGAVRIAQSQFLPADEAAHADVLDVEAGAATFAECAPWAKDAQAAFDAGTRPGQRRPAIYMSASQVTAVVNALNAGGVKGGVSLWVAHWGETDAQARAEITAAAGPFPIIAVQDQSFQFYDASVFAVAWLHDVSVKPVPPPPPSGTATQVRCPGGHWTRLPHSTVEVRPLRDVVLDVRHVT